MTVYGAAFDDRTDVRDDLANFEIDANACPESRELRTPIWGSAETECAAAPDPQRKFISLTWRLESGTHKVDQALSQLLAEKPS
jgi:hypothetical protein